MIMLSSEGSCKDGGCPHLAIVQLERGGGDWQSHRQGGALLLSFKPRLCQEPLFVVVNSQPSPSFGAPTNLQQRMGFKGLVN